jgi:hypothetical protein
MESFREALEDCYLNDLGFVGPKYTSNNGRQDDSFTKEQLDRVVANNFWYNFFKHKVVHVLMGRASNHKPLLFEIAVEVDRCKSNRRGCQFEDSWLLEEESTTVIKDTWQHDEYEGSHMQRVQQKLSRCKSELKRWNGVKHGATENAIKENTKLLKELQEHEGPGTVESI